MRLRDTTQIAAATTTLLMAAAVAGCSTRAGGEGGIRLALMIPPTGPSVSSVAWQVTSAGHAVVRSGTVSTSDPNATASVYTSCPAGSGYQVTLAATASDGSPCSGVSPPFNVATGATAMVALDLVCGGGDPPQARSQVIIHATTIAGDYCPLLTSWNASALRATSGQPVTVSVVATDADSTDVLTYSWTATSGTFASSAAAMTTYICGAPGVQTVTVTVSDGHMPTPCSASMTFEIECVYPGYCGDGIVQPGEQCDPPNGTNCSVTCQRGECGDGVVDHGEQCDPPNPANHCSATCTRIPFCGDGIVDPGEQCDPPNSTSCSATCQNICLLSACDTCEMADTNHCFAAFTVVPGSGTCTWGCNGFAPGSLARTHCEALLSCIVRQNCMVADDPVPCFCGDLAHDQCAVGPPADAPCAAEYAAAGTDGTGSVAVEFYNPSSPVGIANSIAVCDVDSGCACR